jgi:hypothetical protein
MRDWASVHPYGMLQVTFSRHVYGYIMYILPFIPLLILLRGMPHTRAYMFENIVLFSWPS